MTEKNEYVAPLQSKDKLDALEVESGKDKFRFYIEKLGYKWEFNGNKGMSPRVRVSFGKIDRNGDVNKRTMKGIGFPPMTETDLNQIFQGILKAQDFELIDNE